ncbi:class I SAM-dependent methyltransferase [Micromonospora sp. NPDC050417]|uniref:class I SAM-dependent methyltransferase n=1 Tax=Micromonospora sp. NPDC050417 TaxID=3364280 RepID=UPI0037B14EEE
MFESIGRMAADDLRRTARAAGRPFTGSGVSVLDFGCGCGRVLRHFHEEVDRGVRFQGVDVDAEAVAWCAENLGDYGRFDTVERVPPAPFADETFDIVYAVSVFTHLMPEDQDRWLTELGRMLKPSGILMISLLGKTALQLAGPEVVARVEEAGCYYFDDGGTGGLPSWYQSCFHTEGYVRETWGRRFGVLGYIPNGLCRSQDLVVLTRLSE